jgi:hypothetical protein
MVRGLFDGPLANQTTDFHQNGGALDINAVIDRTEEEVRQKKPQFQIYEDSTTVSEAVDRTKGPESVVLSDNSIGLPKTEQTFITNTCRSSTPVDNKMSALDQLNENKIFEGFTTSLSSIGEQSSSSSSSSSGTMSTIGGSALTHGQRAISGVEYSHPFDANLLMHLIATLPEQIEPIHKRKGFFRVKESLPKIQKETVVKLGTDSYIIDRLIATGAYAQVFTAQIKDKPDSILEEEPTNSNGLKKMVCTQSRQKRQ